MNTVFESLAPLHKDWNVSVTTILEGWQAETFLLKSHCQPNKATTELEFQ